MATFWAIVIGAVFVIAIGVIAVLGARALRKESHVRNNHARNNHARNNDAALDSSKDKVQRDRREHQLNQQGDQDHDRGANDPGSGVQVYRH